jgi:hypothetical protein
MPWIARCMTFVHGLTIARGHAEAIANDVETTDPQAASALRRRRKRCQEQFHVCRRRGEEGCPRCYFLKRSLKARRGSSGRPDADDVSRSTVARSEKKVQSLRGRLSAMRSGIAWLHSNRWPGAKWVHCWHACSSAPHLGHWPSPSVNEGRSVPQSAQRKTVRLGSIPG